MRIFLSQSRYIIAISDGITCSNGHNMIEIHVCQKIIIIRYTFFFFILYRCLKNYTCSCLTLNFNFFLLIRHIFVDNKVDIEFYKNFNLQTIIDKIGRHEIAQELLQSSGFTSINSKYRRKLSGKGQWESGRLH